MIGVIVGSLRKQSHNQRLANEIMTLLAEKGHDQVSKISILNMPAYNEDSAPDDAVKQFRKDVEAVDGLIMVVPEYNGSVPGFLKNAIDWMSVPLDESPFTNKPVVIFGSSTGMFGAVWSQADLKKIMGLVKAKVLGEEEIPVSMVHTKETILQGDLKTLIEERLELLIEALAMQKQSIVM